MMPDYMIKYARPDPHDIVEALQVRDACVH